MQSKSIWIVHEKLHMLLLLRNAVTIHGYTNVECFTNGEEVLLRVKKGITPDVIIAEDSLTGISGNDLLTIVDTICNRCTGILLASTEANPYASRHHVLAEGSAGFHEALLEVLENARSSYSSAV
jgi:DNA-binding NtrC family response regulator